METLDDLAVKLRRLHHLIGPDADRATIWDRDYWRTILNGIDRLTSRLGEVAPPVTPAESVQRP